MAELYSQLNFGGNHIQKTISDENEDMYSFQSQENLTKVCLLIIIIIIILLIKQNVFLYFIIIANVCGFSIIRS